MKRLLLLLSVLVLCSCSSFDSEWESALANHAPGTPLTGPWEGTWLSSSNGHSGKLRCIISPSQSSPHHFRYWATWGKFSGTYDGAYQVTETTPGHFSIEGSADLGVLAGGIYSHEGTIHADKFHASYTSESDHGVLEMRRPKIR